jgi:hypothetical protein
MAGMKALKMPWDDSDEPSPSQDEVEATPLGPGQQEEEAIQAVHTPQLEDQEVLSPGEGSIDGASAEPQDRTKEAERALGQSRYRLLMEMVPMMRQLLAERVPAEHLADFLQRHVENLSSLQLPAPVRFFTGGWTFYLFIFDRASKIVLPCSTPCSAVVRTKEAEAE